MKVGFVHPSWPGAEGTGATHTATQIVHGLAERDHDLTVYCPETPPKEVLDADLLYDIRVLGSSLIPHTNTARNVVVRRIVDEFEQYDVLHSYLPSLIPAMEVVGERTSAGTVVTLNAYVGVCPKNDLLYMDETTCANNATSRCFSCILRTSGGHDEFSAPYRAVSRLGNLRLIRQSERNLAAIDRFRAPSAHVKENYAKFGYSENRIQVIPHPIDPAFCVDHVSSFEEPYRLLYVGSLDRHKGTDRLVPILAGLEESDYAFELTIVGHGGLESDMRAQARLLGIENRVTFSGFVPNQQLPGVYAAHDLFLYPGRWDEPLARVYLEALASGTPIVSSEYGNIKDILGPTGRICDGSVEGFRDEITRIIESASLPELSEASAEQVEQFMPSEVVGQISDMYETIVRN